VSSKTKIDALVKSLDAALRRILSHCGVQQVLLIPSDLRALPAAFLRARRANRLFRTFYDLIKIVLPVFFMVFFPVNTISLILGSIRLHAPC